MFFDNNNDINSAMNGVMKMNNIGYIGLIGYFMSKIISNFFNKIKIKKNDEIIDFAITMLLFVITIFSTGIHKLKLKNNNYFAFTIGLLTMTIIVNSVNKLDEITVKKYYTIFIPFVLVLFILNIINIFKTTSSSKMMSLLSYLVYFFTIAVTYILLITQRNKSWNDGKNQITQGCLNKNKNKNNNNTSNSDIKQDNLNEEDNQDVDEFGYCPHDMNVAKVDYSGSNCRILNRDEINTNIGIMLWLLSLLITYKDNKSMMIVKNIHFLIIGAFISYMSQCGVEYILKKTLYSDCENSKYGCCIDGTTRARFTTDICKGGSVRK